MKVKIKAKPVFEVWVIMDLKDGTQLMAKQFVRANNIAKLIGDDAIWPDSADDPELTRMATVFQDQPEQIVGMKIAIQRAKKS